MLLYLSHLVEVMGCPKIPFIGKMLSCRTVSQSTLTSLCLKFPAHCVTVRRCVLSTAGLHDTLWLPAGTAVKDMHDNICPDMSDSDRSDLWEALLAR